MNGFILLHRDLMTKPIWFNSTPEQKVVLITLLTMAAWKRIEWDWYGKKFTLEPGQFITSLPKIAEKCGKEVSIQNVRTALARFKKLEFLTDESTANGRLITITNWRVYQELDGEANRQSNRCLTDGQQTPNRPLTDDQQTHKRTSITSKQSNKENKENKENTIAPLYPPRRRNQRIDRPDDQRLPRRLAAQYWRCQSRTDSQRGEAAVRAVCAYAGIGV